MNDKIKKLKLDLQQFAEDVEPTNTDSDVDVSDDKADDTQGDKKTYTQAEVDELLQREGDRRVSSAREKIIKEYEAKIKKEKEEAKRLAELSAEEREKELARKTKEELEKTKAELRYIHLENDAIDRLNEEGLPIEFKSFVIGKDEETTNERIKLLKEEWDKAIEEEVNNRLKGRTPRRSSTDIANKKPINISELANKNRLI